jgi:hypothetical protein
VWMVILTPERLFAAIIANPTSAPSIIDIHVNENVIAAGDIVFTGIYDIPYTTPPVGTNASQTFIIRLMDPTGTTDLGSAVPYNYTTYEYGYDWGAFSLYFAAGNSLSWGTSYIIQIAENPSQFTSPLVWNTTVTSASYSSVATDQTDQQADMAQAMFTIGSALGTDMGETLFAPVSGTQELTNSGTIYFTGAIESLQAAKPDKAVEHVAGETGDNPFMLAPVCAGLNGKAAALFILRISQNKFGRFLNSFIFTVRAQFGQKDDSPDRALIFAPEIEIRRLAPTAVGVLFFQDTGHDAGGHDGFAGSLNFGIIFGGAEYIRQRTITHRRITVLQQPGGWVGLQDNFPVIGICFCNHFTYQKAPASGLQNEGCWNLPCFY